MQLMGGASYCCLFASTDGFCSGTSLPVPPRLSFSLFRSFLLSLAASLSLSVFVFLTQLVWNVQMFSIGNGRLAPFTYTHTVCV